MNKQPTDWAALTERYYAGETSLEEEVALRRYWQKETPGSTEAELTAYFEAAATEGLSQELKLPPEAFPEMTTQNSVRGRALPELSPSPPKSTLNSVAPKAPGRTAYRRLWTKFAAVASIALLMLSLWMWQPTTSTEVALEGGFKLQEETDWSKYEVSDEEALAILAGSLRQLAKPFNEGAKATRQIGNLSILNNPLPQ